MRIRPCLPHGLLFLSLFLCVAALRADIGGPLKIFPDSSTVVTYEESNLSSAFEPEEVSIADEPVPRMPFRAVPGKRPQIGVLILAGVLGNILGSIAGIYLGAPTFDENHPLPFIAYWAAGSALGSAAGVGLAGTTRNWRGSFGRAVLGGTLGVGLSWLLASSPDFQVGGGMLPLVSLLILPPIGAAVFFKTSVKPGRGTGNQALLTVSAGRLGLGVPDVKVRPIFVPGGVNKPEMQFNVNVLSVEL
jgi:hypothetical protein